ncbi:MAG: peptide ABC transporter substrate-binding protein [Clostridiales bacterium]|jgi:oligopeptide transport system substrate-binding protein|nr:peptide ABC transporter substrate-binding protein [Clostridiales bacterium]
MKKILSLALASVMVFALAACAKQNTDSAPTDTDAPAESADSAAAATDGVNPEPLPADLPSGNGTAINVFKATTPETIDPTMNSSLDGGQYSAHLFEGLMRYKWDGSGIEHGMAEEYTVSDDGLTWTFKLRDSQWSDGQAVKAEDFVYAWRRLVNPEVASPYASDMGTFIMNGEKIIAGDLPKEELGVKALDDKTLEVTLQNPTSFFLQLAAFANFSPLREDAVEPNGDNWTKTSDTFLSNGAFKMQSYATDDRLIIVPNPGYWDAASIVPSQINFFFLADDVAALAAFRAGEIDYIDTPPEEEVQALTNDGLFGAVPQLGTYYVSYNTKKAPLDNVNVRKALTLAIDTDFIANTIRNGAVNAAEAFIGDGFATTDYDSDFRSGWQTYVAPSDYENNKALARQALAEAGYPEGAGFPKLEYLFNDSTTHKAIGEALQNMWKTVLGIDVELKMTDWATVLQDRRNGNFDIARNGWIADYNDPVTMLNLFTSNSGNNDGKYSSADYDAKIAASSKEADPAKRNQLLHEAEDILIGQDWAMGPVFYYTITWAANPKLKGWGVTPLGYQFFHKAYIEP